MARSAECIVCGAPAVAKKRCGTCYQYKRRTGRDRTEDRVVASTERAIHRTGPDAGYLLEYVHRRMRNDPVFAYPPERRIRPKERLTFPGL